MGSKDPRANRNDNAFAHLRLEPNPNRTNNSPEAEESGQKPRRQSPSLDRKTAEDRKNPGGESEVRGRKRRERERRRLRGKEDTEPDVEDGQKKETSTSDPSCAGSKKISGVVMVVSAVKAMKERKGSTEQAIARYLMANYGQHFDHDEKKMEKVLCRGLKTAVNAKLLELPKRGVQRYRLGTKHGVRSVTSPERAKRRGRSRTRKKPGKKRRRRKQSKHKKKHKNKSKKNKKKGKGGKKKHKGKRRR